MSKVKRLNNKLSMKKTDNQPLIDSFVDSYALVEWEPKRPGLIYGLVRYNTIYKVGEPSFKAFKVGQFYHHLQNSYPYHFKLLNKGEHKSCLATISNQFDKKNSWIQQCHSHEQSHSQCIDCKKTEIDLKLESTDAIVRSTVSIDLIDSFD